LGADADIAREVEEVTATDDAQIMADLADAAPIVRFVNLVLMQAVADRASDNSLRAF
jgi:type II secretory ATPase GspE/PulE/Tfp pilus assembly ATPase PilB-like protein